MRPKCLALQNSVDAALSRPIRATGYGRGETIGDQHFGDHTRSLAPIVPPLHLIN